MPFKCNLQRYISGTVKHVKDAKVAVFGCAVDTSATVGLYKLNPV